MIITKRSLPRRTFLRGAGATVALPLLDAMVPALTAIADTPAKPVRRFGAVYVPMGAVKAAWTPKTAGADFEFPTILKPLEPLRRWVTVVSNLDRPLLGTHAVSSGTWLTGCVPKRTEAEDFQAGISLDQIITAEIGRDSVWPSLEIGTENQVGYVGACDPGYSCAYMNTISWKGPTTPLPMEINPRVVFERMFGTPGTRTERVMRMQQNRGILDSVRDDVARVQRGLGPRDRTRLDEYLQHAREVEARIERAERQAATELTLPDAPVGVPPVWEDHASVLFDLLALAFEADISRVFSFLLNREASQLVFPSLGVNEPWHHVSHHGFEAEKLASLVKINTWQITMFHKFLERLRTTPDGDGSLLDHSVLLWGSGMSDSNAHSPIDVPFLMAGEGAGLFKGNRHVVATEGTPLANAMLTIAQKFGAGTDRFGVSTGALDL